MPITRVPLVVLLGAVGCASIRPLQDPARFISEASPRTVYVTHKNGALLTITQPRVSGDSLVGIWQGVSEPLALPLDQVQQVEAMQRDKTRTRFLIAGVSVLTVGMTYLITRQASRVRQPCNFDGGHHAGNCDTDDP